MARAQIGRADEARSRRQYRDAAVLYQEALGLEPDNGPIWVQCGHMFKEAGDFDAAERQYLQAMRLMPDDADLALQMGHFLKLAGRPDGAKQAYRNALRLAPQWDEPRAELKNLQARNAPALPLKAKIAPDAPLAGHLALELLPSPAPRPARASASGVNLIGLGRMERTGWGTQWTLRGVTALRGFALSTADLRRVVVRLDGALLLEEPVEPVAVDGFPDQHKYAFNIWTDVSDIAPGFHEIEFHFGGAEGPVHRHSETVVVARPLDEAAFPDSDGLVERPATTLRAEALAQAINARPSMVRSARRRGFPRPPRTILVQRIDQLGDLVCSIPAIRRLRDIFPQARLIGLVSRANMDFVETLDLFDEILTAEFPDDALEQRRIMGLADQIALHERLAALEIDLAIDLSTSGVSRPLLRLAGAKQTYGFRETAFDWMSADFLAVTRDPIDGLEVVPHSKRVQGLVEWLNVLASGTAPVEPRRDLPPNILAPLGLASDERFVVLHTGARLTFSRWPFYPELAALILARTNLTVVMLSDGPLKRAALPADLVASERVKLLDGRLAFDTLDGLVSRCAAFVGNDSGPKHLASLRGAKVVSLHSARINWNEWGQEHGGLIISRRVPCAGCAIHHRPEECAKQFACITQIKPEEVFGALKRVLETSFDLPADLAEPQQPQVAGSAGR